MYTLRHISRNLRGAVGALVHVLPGVVSVHFVC
jgi:hypothetical protein